MIGAVLRIAANAAPGPLEIPLRLRYQACDEKLCYLPTTVQSAWTVQIGAAGKAARGNREVFDRIRFGTGEAPPASAAPAGTAAPAAGSGDPAARLDRFTDARDSCRLPRSRGLPDVHSQRRERHRREGLVRGPRAARHPLHRLRRRPGAEPDAVRAADDPDQPGDHRRRRPGGIAAPRLPARRDVRRRDGGGLRRARPDRHPHGRHVRHHQLLALVQPRHRHPLRACWRWRCSTSSRSTSRGSRRDSRSRMRSRGTFLLAFTLGALAALLAGACVAPVVIQVVLFCERPVRDGHEDGAGAAVPARVWAWPCRGRSPAPESRPCRSRAPGWSASSRRSACSSSITAAYYGYLAYELLSNRWVDAAEVEGSVDAKLKEGWYSSISTRASPPPSASGSRCSSTSGRPGARTA